MKTSKCVPQKISKFMLALLALGGALGSIVIGFTLLPFFGFMLSLPLLILAVYIFRLHLNDQCEIDLAA